MTTRIADLPIVLPRHVVPMLEHNEHVVTIDDWLTLGERRFRLFGIDVGPVIAIDRAIEEARK